MHCDTRVATSREADHPRAVSCDAHGLDYAGCSVGCSAGCSLGCSGVFCVLFWHLYTSMYNGVFCGVFPVGRLGVRLGCSCIRLGCSAWGVLYNST